MVFSAALLEGGARDSHETAQGISGSWRGPHSDLYVSRDAVQVSPWTLTLHLRGRYQSSLEKFQQNGHTEEEAVELMHRAVRLSSEAISSSSTAEAKTVLSLSCYGSMCSPGQEYAGRYPTPYSPPSTASEAALVDWHYQRMLVFASDEKTWSSVDLIAIETLPLLREGIAVRKAMYRLQATLRQRGEQHWPAWWASFVFPDGKCPEDPSITSEQIARRMLEPSEGAATPNGLGTNCTKLRFLPDLLAGYTEAAKAIKLEERPWLVLYPDGGLVYDVNTRTWHADGPSSSEQENAEPAVLWAQQLYRVTQDAMGEQIDEASPVWNRAIIGGCCKASPAYIGALSKIVRANKAA